MVVIRSSAAGHRQFVRHCSREACGEGRFDNKQRLRWRFPSGSERPGGSVAAGGQSSRNSMFLQRIKYAQR